MSASWAPTPALPSPQWCASLSLHVELASRVSVCSFCACMDNAGMISCYLQPFPLAEVALILKSQ